MRSLFVFLSRFSDFKIVDFKSADFKSLARHGALSCVIGAMLFLAIGGMKAALHHYGNDTPSYEAVAASRHDGDDGLRSYNSAEKRYMRRVLSNNPDVLLKMTSADILAALDNPELARRDGDTVTWQYRSKSCVLDVFIKTPSSVASGEAFEDSILHYEIRNRKTRSNNLLSHESCVSEIIRQKSIPQMVTVGDFLKPGFKR
jgi:hypothetical protein